MGDFDFHLLKAEGLRPDLPQEVRKEAVDAAVQRGEDSLDAYMRPGIA